MNTRTEEIAFKVVVSVPYPANEPEIRSLIKDILVNAGGFPHGVLEVTGLYRLPTAISRSDWPEDP